MSISSVCNFMAWTLCFVFAYLLFGDFIRTEWEFSKEKKKQRENTDAPNE